jgi:hypothetical protein
VLDVRLLLAIPILARRRFVASAGDTAELGRAVYGRRRTVGTRPAVALRLKLPVLFLADDASWEAGRRACSRAVPAFVGRPNNRM